MIWISSDRISITISLKNYIQFIFKDRKITERLQYEQLLPVRWKYCHHLSSNYFILLGTIWISNIKYCIMIISNKMNILPKIIISYFILLPNIIWLVVYLPLWKMMEWKSVGMMKFPTEWKVIEAMWSPVPIMNRSQSGPPGAAGTGASGAWERRQMWRGFMVFFRKTWGVRLGQGWKQWDDVGCILMILIS